MALTHLFSVCLADENRSGRHDVEEVMRLSGTLTQAKQAAWLVFGERLCKDQRKEASGSVLAIYQIWPRDREGWRRHELVVTRHRGAKRWRKFSH